MTVASPGSSPPPESRIIAILGIGPGPARRVALDDRLHRAEAGARHPGQGGRALARVVEGRLARRGAGSVVLGDLEPDAVDDQRVADLAGELAEHRARRGEVVAADREGVAGLVAVAHPGVVVPRPHRDAGGADAALLGVAAGDLDERRRGGGHGVVRLGDAGAAPDGARGGRRRCPGATRLVPVPVTVTVYRSRLGGMAPNLVRPSRPLASDGDAQVREDLARRLRAVQRVEVQPGRAGVEEVLAQLGRDRDALGAQARRGRRRTA